MGVFRVAQLLEPKVGNSASMQGEKTAEERSFRRGDFDMRFVINRPHGHMRIMDYRSGNYADKCALLDRLAQTEGLRKVFTVVEKQDSKNWRSAGFVREAVYPSFFRTADAYMMSRIYAKGGEPVAELLPLKPSADEQIRFPGRKLQKPAGFSLSTIEDEGSRKELVSKANGDLRALPFSRVAAPDMVVHCRAKGGKNAWACAETNDSFGHASVGFAPAPKNDEQMVLSAYAGNCLIEQLIARQVANIFSVSPTDDELANQLLFGLGFKVTGRLIDHLMTNGEHANALLWHRRLIEPVVRT